MQVIRLGRNTKWWTFTTSCGYGLAMAGLKSFLYAVAPRLGVTGSMLYERQRALVGLGVIKSAPGRGPRSGAPLTAENFAAVLISLLATDNLSEVDQRVVAILNAVPDASAAERDHVRRHLRGVTFQSEVALVLSGQETKWRPRPRGLYEALAEKSLAEKRPYSQYRGIRVSRFFRGQIVVGKGALTTSDFIVPKMSGARLASNSAVTITAEIEEDVLVNIVEFLRGALSQTGEEEADE
jgi:hypothetical protein